MLKQQRIAYEEPTGRHPRSDIPADNPASRHPENLDSPCDADYCTPEHTTQPDDLILVGTQMRHGSRISPPNRFDSVHRNLDLEHVEWDQEFLDSQGTQAIEYLEDTTSSIVTENHSPDVSFRYGLNAYRGCLHGCSYCYARPGHEYLGFNAGLDFETKIVIKPRAAQLFREFLSRPRWKPEPIMFSGVTDCYQPAEREFRLTRQCLEVALEFRQPVNIITKNALIVRDLDLLSELARHSLVSAMISITTLDSKLARDMEPRTSVPMARVRAVKMLAEARVPVGVMTAPIIPGLNDSEVPSLLEAASQAGAITAGYTLLRLPLTVEPVFKEWLERTQPDRAEKILGLVRQTRHGKLSNSTFGERMVGAGPIATQIRHLFQVFRKKFGLDRRFPALDCSAFRPPLPKTGQLRLFE